MSRIYSLAYLTAASLSPPDAARLAGKLGYDALGLRIAAVAPGGSFAPLIEDAALLAETKRALQEAGVGVFDVEIVRLGSGFTVESVRPFLECCAALGAKAVLVAGDDPDEGRLVESFAAFAAAAAPYGLGADLEFMPWTKVPDAKTAVRVVKRAGADNGRVLVDALHLARSGDTLAEIAAISHARLGYAQICDGPVAPPATTEGLIHAARHDRWLPGDGDFDLVGLFAALPPRLPVSVEVPNDAGIAEFGQEEWARQALARAKATLALAEARRRHGAR
jgi:sugar phosphate isomerase/epimerase